VEIPATPEQLNAIHAALARFWIAAERELLPPVGSDWRHAFDTAVVEIATNIMRHAYPDRKGQLRLRLGCGMDSVQADFTDSGVPFQPRPRQLQPEPAEREELPEGGFGLDLISAFVDTLDYHRTPNGINHWLLVKRSS
jgi:serine/threonine-protein kinase RsbW